MALYVPFLSVGPSIHKRKGKLIARTPWPIRLLTLGLSRREVMVDPRRQVVVVRRRRFWFRRRRLVVPFGLVKSVTYRYAESSERPWWGTAGDSFDVFTVSLRLHDFSDVHLFTFLGDGEYENRSALPDWLFWPNFALDVAGTQGRESRAYAELLARMLQVPLT
jgi:hypothetical protein